MEIKPPLADLHACIQWWHSSPPYIPTVKSTRHFFCGNLATNTPTGFPYPDNVTLAQDVEGQIRKHGAVPATICVLDGVCRVGLDSKELVQMAETSGKKNTLKVSRRDIAYLTGMVRARGKVYWAKVHFSQDMGTQKLAGKNLNGGTTIAGTMILAEMAGIKVFATGTGSTSFVGSRLLHYYPQENDAKLGGICTGRWTRRCPPWRREHNGYLCGPYRAWQDKCCCYQLRFKGFS